MMKAKLRLYYGGRLTEMIFLKEADLDYIVLEDRFRSYSDGGRIEIILWWKADWIISWWRSDWDYTEMEG